MAKIIRRAIPIGVIDEFITPPWLGFYFDELSIYKWTEPWNIKGCFPESWSLRASVSSSPLPLQPLLCFRSNFRAITPRKRLVRRLIEVTWFIWKLSAGQLIVLRIANNVQSYFLASLGSEHRITDTHIGHQCCDQLTAVKTRYPLTSITWANRGSGFDPSRSSIFWSYPLTRHWFSNDRRLKFNFFQKNAYEIYCVYVPHNFKLTSDAKIQSAATGREDSCFWLFSPCSSLKFIRLLRVVFSSQQLLREL